jgi:hypothetical protein
MAGIEAVKSGNGQAKSSDEANRHITVDAKWKHKYFVSCMCACQLYYTRYKSSHNTQHGNCQQKEQSVKLVSSCISIQTSYV